MNDDPGQGEASLLELQAPSFGVALKAQVLKPSCGSEVFEIAKTNLVRRCDTASAVVADGCDALFLAVPRMRKRCRCGSHAMRASPTCPLANRNVESPATEGFRLAVESSQSLSGLKSASVLVGFGNAGVDGSSVPDLSYHPIVSHSTTPTIELLAAICGSMRPALVAGTGANPVHFVVSAGDRVSSSFSIASTALKRNSRGRATT